jgi:integrase
VPLPPSVYRRLRHYADRSRPSETLADRLFLALRRSPVGTYDPLTSSGVSQLLRTLAVSAGITKRVHPHLLRHSFATWALTRGMNPLTLAQILGHSSLVMIHKVYAHLSPSDTYDALIKVLAEN